MNFLNCSIIIHLFLLWSGVLMECVPDDVEEAFIEYDLTSDFRINGPSQLLKVTYMNSVEVCLGNEVSVGKTTVAPNIYWPAEQGKLSTLICVDPDSPAEPFLHWLIVNIKGNDISSGTEVASYFLPTPPPGYFHRYTFVAFQQPCKIKNKLIKSLITNIVRVGFSLSEFLKEHNLGDTPDAGNFFRAQIASDVVEAVENLNI